MYTTYMVETDAYVVEKYRKFVRHMMSLTAGGPPVSELIDAKPIPSITMLWHTSYAASNSKVIPRNQNRSCDIIEVTYSR
jgi:hypothetical protein